MKLTDTLNIGNLTVCPKQHIHHMYVVDYVLLFQQNVYNKKNPHNFCGSPCWIGTYFTNVAFEKWSLDFLWFMKNLLREYTIFLVSQKNIYTNNWKNLPCIQESLHSSGGGGYFHIDRQVEKCSCIPLRFHVHLCLSSPPYKFALVRLSFADPLVMLKSYALRSTWKAAQ